MMNKYDEKIFQYATKNDTIFELLPKKLHGTGRNIFDFITENILSVGTVAKQLNTRESFYLVMNEEKAELVNIQKDLQLASQDITGSVKIASGKKNFDYNGYRYKIYRKLR